MQSTHRRAPGTPGTWWALVVFAAAVMSLTLVGCIRPPIVKLHDIDVEGFDFQKVDLVFHLKVTNPNGVGLTFSSLTYGLTSAGREIAGGSLLPPVMALSANETAIVRAPISLEYAGLASVLRDVRRGEAIPYQFSSEAKFHFLGLKIPVRMKRVGRMPVLRKPAWHFRDMRLVKGPPSWLELSFEVENPNTFELPLERLRGVVKYGDDVVVRIDEPRLEPIAPGKTGMFTVRVRADGAGVAKAVTKAVLRKQRRRFTFEGQLRMGVPDLLRKMMLEKQPDDE